MKIAIVGDLTRFIGKRQANARARGGRQIRPGFEIN